MGVPRARSTGRLSSDSRTRSRGLWVQVVVLASVVINGGLLAMLHMQSLGQPQAALEKFQRQERNTTKEPESTKDWNTHRRRITWTEFKRPVQSVSDERHAAAVAAVRTNRLSCSTERQKSFSGVKVLVTGLSRSGSTWQYNAVKKILDRIVQKAVHNPTDDIWQVHSAHADGDSEKFDTCLDQKICVLKTHIFVPRLVARVDIILSSHRDIRDVVLSSMLMFSACYAPVGTTRTQRSHGVSVRFQQYAHWTPYVCYDMKYEDMMINATSETARMAAALIKKSVGLSPQLFTLEDAQYVVNEVAALSAKKPDKCVVNTKFKNPPKECWDTRTGFAKSHVHDSTKQPKAWSRRFVLDEVQRRVPTCDVFVAMRRVQLGFAGWLETHGYELSDTILTFDETSSTNASTFSDEFMVEGGAKMNKDEDDDDDNENSAQENEEEDQSWILASPGEINRRRRHLLSGKNNADSSIPRDSSKWQNEFIDSLPEAEYTMDPQMRLPRAGFPVAYPRFVHVINPFKRKKPHPLTTISGEPVDEDATAHASLARAWRVATWYGLDIEIASAVRVGDVDYEELASRWPVRRGCILNNGINTGNGMRLPLLSDLLECADENDSGAQFVILTNPDILVHHHFYLQMYRLVLDERLPLGTAWSITRRQIAPQAFKSLDDVLKAQGEAHLGHDCFIFPRAWLNQIKTHQLVPGFSPWGGAFLAILSHLGRALVLGSKRWTFHLASDGVENAAKISSENRTQLLKAQIIAKRAEVCENAPGTFFNTRQSAAALAASLEEATPERCCCALDSSSAPHSTTRLPSPNAVGALDMLSGPRRPPISPLGLGTYEYLWDRLGPDMTLSRCAALPGIQLLPPRELGLTVAKWCSDIKVSCPRRARNGDCARKEIQRPAGLFKRRLDDANRNGGVQSTVLVVYEKLPTPFEGGHVRVRQLLSWLCYQGHRVLIVHRDAESHGGRKGRESNGTTPKLGDNFEVLNIDLGIKGCTIDNLAIVALDESMHALNARELARQRVDLVILTVWFYRTEAEPIPAIVLPIIKRAQQLRQRKIRTVLISDDVQYERARVVGKARGDDPDYWRKVQRSEIQFYSNSDVDAVFAISRDDQIKFTELQQRYSAAGNANKPPVHVLPYVARVDSGTTRGGWDAHLETYSTRANIVFVGGATVSNRGAIKWLIRAALPALAALPDSDGGCPASRNARFLLVGAAAWSEEVRKACSEARKQRKAALVDLLCDPRLASSNSASKFGKWDARGVLALGRVDDVSAVLRGARVFVAPATVASGISTKVWLGLEHGLPVATTWDGTRGLPESARNDLAALNHPPFILLGQNGSSQLGRETAIQFARDVANVYCKAEAWKRHAKAALQLAKLLESRQVWSDGPLSKLLDTVPSLRCAAQRTPLYASSVSSKKPANDTVYQDSLIDALQTRFKQLLKRHGGSCTELSKTGGW